MRGLTILLAVIGIHTNMEEEKLDILSELTARNCDHITNSILKHTEIVTLRNCLNVSCDWRAIIESYTQSRFSLMDQECLRLLDEQITSQDKTLKGQ